MSSSLCGTGTQVLLVDASPGRSVRDPRDRHDIGVSVTVRSRFDGHWGRAPPGRGSAGRDLVEGPADGLADRADSYPDVLSGGEQQRIAIARALAHEPAVLLADEPTGNLDDATAESVLGLLDTLVRDSGHTMLIATHSQHVASRCDRVLELHNGRIAATGAK